MLPQTVGQDKNQAAAFIVALTNDANAVCEFRAIHEHDRTVPAIVQRGTLERHWQELCEWNARGYGVFMTINETDGQGRDNTHVTKFRAQFVDLDDEDAGQQWQAASTWKVLPNIGVQSSNGKYHIYWLLDEASNRDQWVTVQRKLTTNFNGDPAIHDPARIMRLPGTIHAKREPTLVTMYGLGGGSSRTSTAVIDMHLWNVAASEQGVVNGDRIPIGDGERAPSLQEAIDMLNKIDVCTVDDRNRWLAIAGAFMQSVNLHDPAEHHAAYNAFMWWNSDYVNAEGKPDDPAANTKVWNDTVKRGTVVKGWSRLHKEATDMSPQQARLLAGAALVPLSSALQKTAAAAVRQAGQSMGAHAAQDGLGEMLHAATISNTPSALIEVVKAIVGKICVGFDSFSQQTLLLTAPPWAKLEEFPRPWSDTDTVNCQLFVQTLFNEKGVLRPGKDTVFDAISLVANHRKLNPLQDYLASLQWDGVNRLSNMLSKYFGADDTLYHQMIGEKFMISAIARAIKPGCKVDTVLILEGKQGVNKSSSVAALASEIWFTDELPDLNSKDSAIQLVGKWIVEVSELSAFNRSDTETIKKFMSRSTDRFRAPYGKVASDHPRQAVFVATTNDDHYLKDTTGNRRFWPVKCGRIDVAAIRCDRDQLWAEAREMYRDGAQWWLNDEEAVVAEAEQDARCEVDPWEEQIARVAGAMGSLPLTIDLICVQLGIPFERRNAAVNSRVSKCLRLCGYERRRLAAGSDGKRAWAYFKI